MAFDPAVHFHFREASWEEALELAATGFQRIKDRDGSAALAGFGSAKGTNEEAYLVQKFVRTAFGTNNVDHCTRLCHASSVAALLENIGSGAVTASFSQCQYSDAIIVIGASLRLIIRLRPALSKMLRGAKLYILDPRGQALDECRGRRILPGSDVAY